MKQILIVEDDSFLNKMLAYNLTADGYGVTSVLNARTAADVLRQREFDLVLLDINLPDGNGFELCRLIKPQHPDTIVIFLTANDQESDQIRGYEVGAVDYITKPFVIGALQRKIKAMFAMLEHHKPAKDIYDDGRLFLDFSEQTASLNGKPLTLSPMEYKMLNLFRKNPRQVLTRGQLLEKLWDIDEKLDFLFQALVKTSRLETGVIQLDKKPGRLFDTVAQAMSGIVYAAEKKEIAVSVDCPEDLAVSHDSKWTSEALFNLLDNAVKYTPAGGKIAVSVVLWEMYVEIKVADTGKGISESNQAAIFRRFYREEEVHEQQGVGIGLYLAREIITRQGGYIRLVSEPGRGSKFSIMLPTK